MVMLLAASIVPAIVYADDTNEPMKNKTNVSVKDNNGQKNGQEKNPHTIAARNGLDKGKSPVEHLYLYEKDPTSWNITENGSWGKLTILTQKDKYIFNAHKLNKTTSYALINYAQGEDWDNQDDPWAKEDILIGSGETGEGTNLHIMGKWSNTIQGKVWLVNPTDYNYETQQMTGWNPKNYLFEYDLIKSQTMP